MMSVTEAPSQTFTGWESNYVFSDSLFGLYLLERFTNSFIFLFYISMSLRTSGHIYYYLIRLVNQTIPFDILNECMLYSVWFSFMYFLIFSTRF